MTKKGKWCPHSAAVNAQSNLTALIGLGLTINNVPPDEAEIAVSNLVNILTETNDIHCIGEKCAMWWEPEGKPEYGVCGLTIGK